VARCTVGAPFLWTPTFGQQSPELVVSLVVKTVRARCTPTPLPSAQISIRPLNWTRRYVIGSTAKGHLVRAAYHPDTKAMAGVSCEGEANVRQRSLTCSVRSANPGAVFAARKSLGWGYF